MRTGSKLIVENWRTYLKESDKFVSEEELNEFLNVIVEEGLIDFGKGLWSSVKNKVAEISKWGTEKLQDFVKKISLKIQTFFQKLKQKKVVGKYTARREIQAARLLTTKKHIKLGVLVFTGILKATGGLAIDLLTGDLVKKIKEVFDQIISGNFKEALTTLFGSADGIEAIKMIKQFKDFSKDTKSVATAAGKWDKFGGMAEDIMENWRKCALLGDNR